MEKNLKRVLFITNIPVPYRVDFYNELGKFCHLTVIFEAKRVHGITFNWKENKINNFDTIFLSKGNIKERKINFKILKHIRKNFYDAIFITNYAYLTETLALLSFKLRSIPYYYEIDGAIVKEPESLFKKNIKSFFLRGAQAYLSPSKESDNYIHHYVSPKAIIHRYPFTSLEEGDILKRIPGKAEKLEIREKLNVKEPKMILAVGQFITRKGFDILLRAAQNLNKDIGIYIVGGEPTEEYLNLQRDLDLTQVHFEGFKTKEDLKEYFKAADLFIHPTREDIWGLVINEAMAYGLPVITTNKCIAGLELIQDKRCIVDVGDIAQLAVIIKQLINDDISCEKLAEQNLNKIRTYTIEKMVEAHMNFLLNNE